LSTPRITVGLPVYKGADLVAKTLKCLQRQTFGDFEAIISVDGNDAETAAACRPFLADPRFRMVVHLERLDWFGNFNWLLQQELRDFFCYRQHDDTTAPEFFEVLLQAADNEPNAAAVYSDCQWMGGRKGFEIASSIEGAPLDRMFQYIERQSAVPVRGLIRRAAIQQAGLLRSDEFRAIAEIFVWLAKVLRCGNFRRIAAPLYYRLDHANNYHKQVDRWPEDRKRAAATTLFTGLLEATMPLCRTLEERRLAWRFILDRIVLFRPGNEHNPPGKFIAHCIERLRYEGNIHLLGNGELSSVLAELQGRQDEIKLLEQSRTRRVIYRIRQRSRMARVIYPRSIMQRVVYQIRHLLKMLSDKIITLQH
jgi:glycosyltransferase involved in cell wall biosynthesis